MICAHRLVHLIEVEHRATRIVASLATQEQLGRLARRAASSPNPGTAAPPRYIPRPAPPPRETEAQWQDQLHHEAVLPIRPFTVPECVSGQADAHGIIDAIWSNLGQLPLCPSCFSDEIVAHEFLEKFQVRHVEKYNGKANQEHWLSDYLTAVQLANGDDFHAIKHLPLMLTGSARAWLNSLAPNLSFVSPDLHEAFLMNFQGRYQWPPSQYDLGSCVQEEGESIHNFISRWLKKKNNISDVMDAEAIAAFRAGCMDKLLTHELGRSSVRTKVDLMRITNDFNSRDEEWIAKKTTRKASTSRDDPGTFGSKDEYGRPRATTTTTKIISTRMMSPTLTLSTPSSELSVTAVAKARRSASGSRDARGEVQPTPRSWTAPATTIRPRTDLLPPTPTESASCTRRGLPR